MITEFRKSRSLEMVESFLGKHGDIYCGYEINLALTNKMLVDIIFIRAIRGVFVVVWIRRGTNGGSEMWPL